MNRNFRIALVVLGIVIIGALIYKFLYYDTLPGVSPTPSPNGSISQVEGTVSTISASAQVIVITNNEGVEQFLALQPDTIIHTQTGDTTTLAAITPGMRILARGRYSNTETMLPEEVRIVAAPSPTPIPTGTALTTTFQVYFNNTELDPQITCTRVFPVSREVPRTQSVARAALLELLKGPTQAELQDNYMTALNPNVALNSVSITNGVAHADFSEQLGAGVAGSCRVSAIRAQITETLKQFPTVQNVVISINGRSEDVLQP